MAAEIKTVGVIGTGVIGASWTALFLARGKQVLVSDPGPGAEEALAAHLKSIWPVMEQLGLSPGASLNNYRFVGPSLEKHYGDVDFVQENAPERLALKIRLFAEIDAGARPEVVIASSSSGLPSSQFITDCKAHPERVLIGHPFNPPHLMPLVEVVPHPGTSKEVVSRALDIYTAFGKRPCLVKKELPGHAANRLQAALISEAYSLVARGVVSAADVDACMTTSLGPRWAFTGPFMANVLGGGGERDSFRHFFQHLGPAMRVWLDDMEKHKFSFTDEEMAVLDANVQEELDMFDVKLVEQQRDELLIPMLKGKAKSSALV